MNFQQSNLIITNSLIFWVNLMTNVTWFECKRETWKKFPLVNAVAAERSYFTASKQRKEMIEREWRARAVRRALFRLILLLRFLPAPIDAGIRKMQTVTRTKRTNGVTAIRITHRSVTFATSRRERTTVKSQLYISERFRKFMETMSAWCHVENVGNDIDATSMIRTLRMFHS